MSKKQNLVHDNFPKQLILHKYDRCTKEYLNTYYASVDPKNTNEFLIDAFTTTIQPPKRKTGYAIIFNLNEEKWEYIIDYRGTLYWLPNMKYDDKPMQHNVLGPLPKGIKLKPPNKPKKVIMEEKHKKLLNELNNNLEKGFSFTFLNKNYTIPLLHEYIHYYESIFMDYMLNIQNNNNYIATIYGIHNDEYCELNLSSLDLKKFFELYKQKYSILMKNLHKDLKKDI